ncbi:MAG: hypothetical protein U0457_19395 [Candidatus Sericytochromatia bacterium]
MLDLSILKSAKKKAEENHAHFDNDFDKLVSEGYSLLEDFLLNKSPKLETLEKAANKLVEATDIKKNNAKPFFYLACIFYLMNQIELAIKYIHITSFLEPDFDGLEKLRNEIVESTSTTSVENTTENNSSNEVVEDDKFKEIKKISESALKRPQRLKLS